MAELDSKLERPILVTSAAGQVGSFGRSVVGLRRQRGLRIRAAHQPVKLWCADYPAVVLRAIRQVPCSTSPPPS
jgi:hypothetical protein